MPGGHASEQRRGQALIYLDQKANALYRHGDEFGDNDALIDAIACYRALLMKCTTSEWDIGWLDWGITQSNLGNALEKLGEGESDTQHLEEAIEAYQAAQDNQSLGLQHLEEAVEDYESALNIFAAMQAAYYVSVVRSRLEHTRAILARMSMVTAVMRLFRK